MEVAISVAKEEGKIVKGVLSYTISPVHTVDYFVGIAKQLRDLGVDIISIKDQAGILSPKIAYELVGRLKEEVKLPVHLHAQTTSGMAEMTCLKAVEAGCDIIDTDVSTWSWLTAHPANETMVYVLKEFGYETKIDLYNRGGCRIPERGKKEVQEVRHSGEMARFTGLNTSDARWYDVKLYKSA